MHPRKSTKQRWKLNTERPTGSDYFEHEFADKSSLLWWNNQKYFLYLNQTGTWIKSSLDQNIADDVIVDLLHNEFSTPRAISRNIIESLKDPGTAAIRSRCEQATPDEGDIDMAFPFEEFNVAEKCPGERTKTVEIEVAGISICLSYFSRDIDSSVTTRPFSHLITDRKIDSSIHAINAGKDQNENIWAGSSATGYFYANGLPELSTLLYWMVFKTVEASQDWLVALHAGGVVTEHKPILIIGPGGAGKSTLTVALMKKHNSYLTDELITITRHRRLILPLPTLPCIKEEGWAAVDTLYPALKYTDHIERLNRNVKYLPIPAGIRTPDHVVADNALILFPKFCEHQTPGSIPLSIGEAIERLLDAGGLIGDISSQDQFSDFCHWIGSLESYELNYRSTEEGLELIDDILNRNSVASR